MCKIKFELCKSRFDVEYKRILKSRDAHINCANELYVKKRYYVLLSILCNHLDNFI